MGVFFFKQKTAYEMRISDWSSDVCSSDLEAQHADRDVVQLLLAGLEQLVAREGLEEVDQRLAVVAGRPEPGARHQLGDALAQQRDLLGALEIGRAHV